MMLMYDNHVTLVCAIGLRVLMIGHSSWLSSLNPTTNHANSIANVIRGIFLLNVVPINYVDDPLLTCLTC